MTPNYWIISLITDCVITLTTECTAGCLCWKSKWLTNPRCFSFNKIALVLGWREKEVFAGRELRAGLQRTEEVEAAASRRQEEGAGEEGGADHTALLQCWASHWVFNTHVCAKSFLRGWNCCHRILFPQLFRNQSSGKGNSHSKAPARGRGGRPQHPDGRPAPEAVLFVSS